MGTFLSAGLTGGTLAVIMCSTAGLLVLSIGLLVIWRRRRQRRDPFDLSLENVNNEGLSVKSAPASRTPSPRQVKRLSCPDAFSMPMRGDAEASVPAGHDYILPSERVQPRSAGHSAPVGHSGGPIDTRATGLPNQQSLVGGLQPQLYSHRGSVSEDDDIILPRSTCGRLWYSLVYDTNVEYLNVTLIKVKDLPGRGSHNHPRDPYVKVFVLPDDRTCRTSKVRKKTLSPVFNEHFLFQVPAQELTERTLRFSVYDVDKKKVRHSLGHVMVPLRDVDLDHGDTCWSDLEANTQTSSCSLGEVQLGLCYQPQNEKVKVTVLRVRHLQHAYIDNQSSVYVRVQLYYGRKLQRVKRTGSRPALGQEEEKKKKAEEEVVEVNESFSFSVAGRQLESCRLEVTLMLNAPPHLTAPLPGGEVEWGHLVLGPFMYARGEQLLHWQHMLAQPRVAVTRWHALSTPVAHD